MYTPPVKLSIMAMSEISLGLAVGGLLLVVYLLYRLVYAPYQLLKNYGIKGPTPIPVFGNYKERIKMGVLNHDKYLIENYGPVSGFYIGQLPHILITDLEMIKQIVVKDIDSFTDHAVSRSIMLTRPSDLFSSKGETWRTMRKSLSPSFSTSKLKMMLPLLKRSTDNLVAVVGENAASGRSFDVTKVYTSFTLETVVATAFGRLINIQRGESDDFIRSMDLLLGDFTDGKIEKLVMLRSHFPWLLTVLSYIYPYSESGKAYFDVQRMALDLVKARREASQTERYKDILQLMIEASNEAETIGKKETAVPAECPAHKATKTTGVMIDIEVVANSIGFLIAGNETTATTLSFASYLLALNPNIQEKLQFVIDAYFKDRPESTLYMAAQEITYLDNVVQETLRLHPPIVETDRYCKKTTVVKGVTIPKGAVVVIPISLLHYSTQYWKDPEVFDPERFTAEERAKRPQLCHMPFGYGPRNCIGMRMALIQVKVALIELLQRYTFVRADETEVPPTLSFSFTVRPTNGIYLKVRNRC